MVTGSVHVPKLGGLFGLDRVGSSPCIKNIILNLFLKGTHRENGVEMLCWVLAVFLPGLQQCFDSFLDRGLVWVLSYMYEPLRSIFFGHI